MKLPGHLLRGLKRGPRDVVGVDVETSGISVVRMRRESNQISVLAAGTLPAAPIQSDGVGEETGNVSPLSLPGRMRGRYACIVISADHAVIKLLSCPGQFDSEPDAKVMETMGLENPEHFRVGYKIIAEGTARTESRVLAVALPKALTGLPGSLFPSGLPAPFSMEVSGLATMSAFLHGTGRNHESDTVGALDFGGTMTTLALFSRGALVLFRRFHFGTDNVLGKIESALGVDRATAAGILSDGAFDISQSLLEVMDHVVKQVIISRDFVERRHNCHLTRLYLSGYLAASKTLVEQMRHSIGIDIGNWNPFDGLTLASGAMDGNLAGQEWRFAAAIGACLATFEET